MILTVPVQIDLSSPFGWVVAGIVIVLAIWGSFGILRQARRLWRRSRLGQSDWRRPPDGSGGARGDLWSGGGENFRRWLRSGRGPPGGNMGKPLVDILLIGGLLGNAVVAYFYRAELIAIGTGWWDTLASAW